MSEEQKTAIAIGEIESLLKESSDAFRTADAYSDPNNESQQALILCVLRLRQAVEKLAKLHKPV